MNLFKNRFFKNKFFIIILCTALILSIFLSVLSVMGVLGTAKNMLNNLLSPVQDGIWKIKKSLEGYSLYFSDVDSLIEENSRLNEEIKALKEKENSAKLTEEENRRLRNYLSMKEEHESFVFEEALVIGANGDNYMSILRINKGSDDGIKENMPVVVAEGLVGCVSEVGKNWSSVRVICESSAGAGAYISRNGVIGVVQGDITYRDQGVCKLNYLDIDADVQIGDLVYTSGSGSVYPGGLLIGKVSSVGIDELSRSKIATVTCSVDFKKLSYVMIVTDFERISSEAGA